MTGDEVRQVFEAMLPQAENERLGQPCGVSERQCQRPLGMLVRAMVMSAGTPGGAAQADPWRAYLEFAGPRVTRAACSRWFDAPLEPCMAALAEHALVYAQAQQVDLPGPLSGVKDCSIVDATTVTVHDVLIDAFPGTGDDAALKGHTVLAGGCGAPVGSHVSPAREHDRRHLTIDESSRGCDLLTDLGYASLARLRACDTHDVRFVIRLKDHWKPKVASIARRQVTGECFPGTALDALMEEESLVLDGRAIAADVRIGGAKQSLQLRLVGVRTPKGSGLFLTTLPPRRGPLQVADRSRVRWEVARSLRLDQSMNRLDAIAAEQPCCLKTLLQASLIASTIAAILAHTHNLKTRPPQGEASRTEAPLHPRRLALQLAVSCQSIAQAFDLKGTAAKRPRDKIAAWLTHAGKAPH